MKGCCEGVNLLKVAYAILDKKGRIAVDDEEGLCVYKTKRAAQDAIIEEYNEETGEDETTETVLKVSIIVA